MRNNPGIPSPEGDRAADADERVASGAPDTPSSGDATISGRFKVRDSRTAYPDREPDPFVRDGRGSGDQTTALAAEILRQGHDLGVPDETAPAPFPTLVAAGGDHALRGLALTGVTISEVRGIGCHALLLRNGDEGAGGLVQVTQSWPPTETDFPGTVLVRFADGGGIALAVPPKRMCRVVVDPAGSDGARVNAVTFLHSNSQAAADPAPSPQRPTLVAAVSRLARQGLFRVEDEQSAALTALASEDGLGNDPALALLAAYALNDVGRSDRVRDLTASCSRVLDGLTLYDLALLARNNAKVDSQTITPFCPLLSRGWQFLRVMGAEMPPFVQEAGLHRRAALWTTFDRDGMDILLESNR